MSERLRPDYTRSPSLEDLLNSHASAEAALDAGDHYIALVNARNEGRIDIEAAALLMCGAVDQVMGWPELSGALTGLPHFAYGTWCRGDTKKALAEIEKFEQFSTLHTLLRQPEIKLFIIAAPHTRHGIPTETLDGFEIEGVILERSRQPDSLADLLPSGFRPDAIFVLDVFGPRLPNDLYDADAPVIFLSYDFDIQLPHQSQDLERADLHIVNSGYEHYYCRQIYDGPVSAYPAFALTSEPLQFSESRPTKDIDFLHTGLSFTPTMREKAQFLFGLAATKDPNLTIKIHHGFLPNDEYRDAISRTSWMPCFNARMTGGLQSRTMDAVCNGAALLHGGEDHAIEMFEATRSLIHQANLGDLQPSALSLVRDTPVQVDKREIRKELFDLFPPPSERVARFYKFALFEWARRGCQRPDNLPLRTTAITGLDACLSGARTSRQQPNVLYAQAHFRAVEQVIESPFDDKRHSRVDSIFDEIEKAGAITLTVLFNQARALWMRGDQNRAAQCFTRLTATADALPFDPRRECVLLHLFEAASEMFPFQDYALAACRDAAEGFHGAQDIISATADTYLGLRDLQSGKLAEGLAHLDQALALFPDHFPAARLRFKAVHALERPLSEIAEAFDYAVNCYPPVINELLPFAVSSELGAGREEEALSLVQTWAYFITRCTWEDGKEPATPDVTFRAVRAFVDRLPDHLREGLHDRFPHEFGAA